MPETLTQEQKNEEAATAERKFNALREKAAVAVDVLEMDDSCRATDELREAAETVLFSFFRSAV